MTRFSIKESHILRYLIINCEIWHLNEIESLRYIHEKFGKHVSRRTYYNYKKKILEQMPHQEASRLILSDIKHFNSNIRKKFYLKMEKDKIMKSPYISSHQMQNYDDFGGIPASFSNKIMFSSSRSMEKLESLKQRIEKETESQNARRIQIPLSATLREEYVLCNKLSCNRCKHGPYLYAYWRDEQSKLRKKYIGTSHTGSDLQRTKGIF